MNHHQQKSISFLSFLLVFFLLSQSIITVTAQTEQKNKFPPVVTGRTIYVDDDSPWGDGSIEHPFQRIKDGIDAAQSGDTVYVFEGAYLGGIIVDKSITLTGENKVTTAIGIDCGSVLEITAGHVTVSGFSIVNVRPFSPGVKIHIVANFCTIANNLFIDYEILDCIMGIYLVNASYNVIQNNVFSADGHTPQLARAIYVINSHHNIISDNTIGLYLSSLILINSSDNMITNNRLPTSLLNHSFHNIFSGNNFSTLTFHDSSDNNIIDNNFCQYGLKLRKEIGRPQVDFRDSDNLFDHNYWGRLRLLPKVLFGHNGTKRVVEVDWNPAIKPN